jgi:general secretion pathway protein E/type IV pilus assembly protein PilB
MSEDFSENQSQTSQSQAVQNSSKEESLGDILIKKGLISSDQLQIALHEQKNEKHFQQPLEKILVHLGFVTDSALAEIISENAGVTKMDLNTVIDPATVAKLPKEIATKFKAIPVSQDNDTVFIAMSDIYNIMILDQIRKYFDKSIKLRPVYAQDSHINDIIEKYYHYEMSIDGILKEIETGITDDKQAITTETDSYVNPTVRLVDAFLIDAIKKGASDIHFEPEETFIRIRYRIDGKLTQIRSFHIEYWQAIVVRIKILSSMNIAETRHAQDGRIIFNFSGREIDFRVSIRGENIVLRILDSKKSLVSMSELGFSEANSKLLKKLLKRPEGIIIVTGPTGSGKTTTLYSILNYINTIEKNIMTLEDPVEYQLPLIRQSNVREGSGMTFAEGIKALMRQDPDVIFIGEVRDASTATMALRAAMTGHQVFSTLHTNDAIGAIARLADIGIQRNLLSGSLICVMAQRLTRKLCEHCKKAVVATADECRILGLYPENPSTIYQHVGCKKCEGKGFKGRIAICEILAINKGLDELIATNATRQVMLDYAIKHGFLPMIEDGVDKVLKGVVELAELIETIDMTTRL